MNTTFHHNLTLALGVSALMHLLFIFNLNFPVHTPPPSEIPVEFMLTQPSQIVSPSESTNTTPPDENVTRLSERDSQVPREMINRAAPGAAMIGPSDKTPSTNQPLEQKQPSRQNKAPPLIAKAITSPQPPPILKLDPKTTIEQFGKQQERVADPLAAQANPSYQAFSRPAGSGAKFFGNGGSPDYLPSLPDGDLTLLNAKANQYAVFVRRVATQVFSELRQVGWEALRALDIQKITEDATYEAVMGPSGELLSVQQLASSGSLSFDKVLGTAIEKGARDRNPPQGAAADDGNLHFIFKARSWVTINTNPRSQAPFERRWLLLATGLL